jgi:hypothetical protein
VTAFSNSFEFLRRAMAPATCAAMLFATLLAAAAPRSRTEEPASDTVGEIEGEAINITGPMTVEATHGQIKTVLRSGSDVRVKSGTARIDLVEGGQISICGPAHLSVLKSGGSLTIALDTGAIHVHIERAPALIIYTPQIQLQSVSIGDGPEDLLVGFESPGAMCVRANRGAVRLEQQLTGQTVLLPQTSDVILLNGQLENLRPSAGHCVCDLQLSKATPPLQPQIGQLASSEDLRKKSSEPKPSDSPTAVDTAPAKEEPIYQVFMPPLVYDANAKVQPEIDPRMIMIVRRVRVRPTLIFQGRVEGEIIAAATPAPPSAAAASSQAAKPGSPLSPSFVDRVRTFIRKLWASGS